MLLIIKYCNNKINRLTNSNLNNNSNKYKIAINTLKIKIYVNK